MKKYYCFFENINFEILIFVVFRIYLLFIRAVLFVVYTYAGIVKINEDWLRGEPLRHWVGHK